jgi:hypothetical protein
MSYVETIRRIAAKAAMQGAAVARSPGRRKVFAAAESLQREVDALETTLDGISTAVETIYGGIDEGADDATSRELLALRRQAEAAIATASDLRDRITSARDTLAQLEEAGVLDAVEDDRALEELEARLQAADAVATAALDFIDAAQDELAERRALGSTVYSEF